MNFTGLSEFLWFLLVFGAMFAFTVWRQQRDRRRREERMAAMSAPPQVEPATVPVPAAPPPRTAPDISWGRGPAVPAPPPEVRPDWREAAVLTQAPALPSRTTPARAPRRTAPVAAAVAARRGALQFRSEAGLRQAMVALTVLGPCRAIEPYGADGTTQAPGSDSRPRPRPQGL